MKRYSKNIGNFSIPKQVLKVSENSVTTIGSNFGIQKDLIANNLLIADKLIVPKYSTLPAVGNLGEIVFNQGDTSFYGWNGNEWFSIGSSSRGGFERVTGSIANPNVETSLVQGGGIGQLFTQWGALVGGPTFEILFFLNQSALNNLDQCLVGIITNSDPIIVYNVDRSIAFTLDFLGPNPNLGQNFNNIFVKYSSEGTPKLVGNVFSYDEESFLYNYSVDINDSGYSVVNGFFFANNISICDGSNQPVSSLSGPAIFLVAYTPLNSLSWATKISGELSLPLASNYWNCAIADNGETIVSGAFINTLELYNADTSFSILTSQDTATFVAKYTSTGYINWVTKITGATINNINVPCDINYETSVIIATNANSDITPYNFDGSPSETVSLNGFDSLSAIVNYTPSGTIKNIVTVRSNENVISDLKITNSGDIYACGQYNEDILNIYNSNGGLEITLPASQNYDVFIVKWSASGQAEWVARIIGVYQETYPSIDVNDFGNMVVSGYYQSDEIFIYNGSGQLVSSLTKVDNNNFFIATFKGNGDFISSAKLTSAFVFGEGIGASVCTNNSENVTAAGSFGDNSMIAFNAYNSVGITFDDNGAFVIKYNAFKEVSLGNPATDGQEKIIAASGNILVNTASLIEGDSNRIKLSKYDSLEMLWDAVENNWIVVSNEGSLI